MNIEAPLTFLRQSLKDFHATGAVAPSSPFLARAMVKSLPKPKDVPSHFRVLEAGPGTGAFTKAIAKRLRGRGRLDLYEISPSFVAHLHKRIVREHAFARIRGRVAIVEGDVRELPAQPTYDAIISGLPLNNFSPGDVRAFLEHFQKLLRPGGTLTYFEYVAIRRLRTPFANGKGRERLEAVGRVVNDFVRTHQVRQRIVALNVPPAWVRYFRFDKKRLA